MEQSFRTLAITDSQCRLAMAELSVSRGGKPSSVVIRIVAWLAASCSSVPAQRGKIDSQSGGLFTYVSQYHCTTAPDIRMPERRR